MSVPITQGQKNSPRSVKGIATRILPSKIIEITKKPSVTDRPTPTPTPDENIITYNNEGFFPATLTIQKGETVIFKNRSKINMWVASNYYPTSMLYPGTSQVKCKLNPVPTGMFQECMGVGNGKSWSFTFTKVGRWPYHNYLKPDDEGVVTVSAN